jgi:hypothetical protein
VRVTVASRSLSAHDLTNRTHSRANPPSSGELAPGDEAPIREGLCEQLGGGEPPQGASAAWKVQGFLAVVVVNRQHDGQLQELAWVNVDDRLATISWLAGPPCATSSRSAAPTASPGARARLLPVHPHADQGRERRRLNRTSSALDHRPRDRGGARRGSRRVRGSRIRFGSAAGSDRRLKKTGIANQWQSHPRLTRWR